jgi:hypothetical protein
MPKPKAPRWLTESFRDGVDEAYGEICILDVLDPLQRPCTGKLERFHWIGRQRVENALGALMPSEPYFEDTIATMTGTLPWSTAVDLILLAAWDPRNGCVACEGHHRRFDGHLTSELKVPWGCLPGRFLDFVYDWGLESELERKFPLGELVYLDAL